MEFAQITNNPDIFWNILPKDWREPIQPEWEKYKSTTTIYVIRENSYAIGGGLIFKEVSPDMEYAREEANKWIKKNYLYIGYLFIDEKYRGRKLGSYWLKSLFSLNPLQNYWLTIEDPDLLNFYTKNCFVYHKTLNNKGVNELLLLKH